MVVDKVGIFWDQDLVGESFITSFRWALGNGLGKSVSGLLIGIVPRSLGMLGGQRGEVLEVLAGVFRSHWIRPRGLETH
jgi:hypothetical protein